MKKILSLFAAVLVLGIAVASAQQATPIRWRMVIKMTSPSEGYVTVRALLDEGWHLYGFNLPKGGPKPTELDFAASEGVTFTGKPVPSVQPVEKEDSQFGGTLQQWESNVSFTQKFKLSGKRDNAKIVLNIKYMGCNDVTCLPPSSTTLSTPVPVYKKN